MPKASISKPSLLIINKIDEIKNFIDLADKKVKDIDPWRNVWERINMLDDNKERISVEEFLMGSMSMIKFPFWAGIALFNDGCTTCCVNHTGEEKAVEVPSLSQRELFLAGLIPRLGRGAMWLGIKIARDAINRFRKDSIYLEQKFICSVDYLLKNYKNKKRLTPEDRHYCKVVFGSETAPLNAGRLKQWLIKSLN